MRGCAAVRNRHAPNNGPAGRLPSVADIGAYEFRGNSNDTLAPTIQSSSPSIIDVEGITAQPIDTIQLTFSEEVNPIDARSPAAYEFRGAGPNNDFDDADDLIYGLAPQYSAGQDTVTLGILGISDMLLPGRYRLTVLGSQSSSIHDLAGIRLDGDGDSNAGGNYSRIFRVIANDAPVLNGAHDLIQIDEDLLPVNNPGDLITSLIDGLVSDPDGPAAGIAITGVDLAHGYWEFTLDGDTYLPIAPAISGGQVLLLAADSNTRVRFVPDANFSGQAGGISFHAWDRSDEQMEGVSVFADHLFTNSLSNELVTARIEVLEVNDAPENIVLSSGIVGENMPAGTVVGTLSAVDVDLGDQHSFTLVSGAGATDNVKFVVVGNELRTTTRIDFELHPVLSIRVRATDNSGASFEKILQITIDDRTEVESVVVGDGTSQRSRVDQVQVVFDGLVDIVDLNQGAFAIRKRGVAGGSVSITAVASNDLISGKTVVTLTFNGGMTEIGGSLKDGFYELMVDATKVRRAGTTADGGRLDGNLDGVAGGDFVFGADPLDNFFRFFGDVSGDGSVTLQEFNQFRSAYGKSVGEPGYQNNYDFSGDGVISLNDFNSFRSRFGRTISWE